MKKTFILKTYNIFHKILLIILLVLLAKLVIDFYNKNKSINSQTNNINSKINKEIYNPQLQLENGGFQFIQAEKGIEINDKEYVLYNVKTNGDFAEASSGILEITDNKNTFTFTENPKFRLYINEFKK